MEDNFTKGYRITRRFEIKVMNQQTFQTGVSTFPNVSLKGIPFEFLVKSCQIFQNTLVVFFIFKKKENYKFFKDSSMGIFANSVKF